MAGTGLGLGMAAATFGTPLDDSGRLSTGAGDGELGLEVEGRAAGLPPPSSGEAIAIPQMERKRSPRIESFMVDKGVSLISASGVSCCQKQKE